MIPIFISPPYSAPRRQKSGCVSARNNHCPAMNDGTLTF
jgi:hypothetical protein